DDPIQAATSEWLESRGRNPFMDLTLPAASIRLVQACGRLIRKETDSGRISILDRRLTTTRYGKLLLDSLPPLRRM
ncbi:helicase C-terminal domain-containing protein, partial [Gilvimarinus sp. 1_MG-2023]